MRPTSTLGMDNVTLSHALQDSMQGCNTWPVMRVYRTEPELTLMNFNCPIIMSQLYHFFTPCGPVIVVEHGTETACLRLIVEIQILKSLSTRYAPLRGLQCSVWIDATDIGQLLSTYVDAGPTQRATSPSGCPWTVGCSAPLGRWLSGLSCTWSWWCSEKVAWLVSASAGIKAGPDVDQWKQLSLEVLQVAHESRECSIWCL